MISVCTTLKALESVKANKATGSDNIPALVLRNHADVLAHPLTAIFKSLREYVYLLPVTRTDRFRNSSILWLWPLYNCQ